MTETDLSSLSVEEIFKFLESNNADVVAEVQAMFHQNLSHTKDGWLVHRHFKITFLTLPENMNNQIIFIIGKWSL